MYDNDMIKEKSMERDFLNRSLIDNSKSRICYGNLREKYFGYEIAGVKLARVDADRKEAAKNEAYKRREAKLEAKRLEAIRIEAEKEAALNNVEEGDMMKNNELEKVVVNAPSSEPVVKLTKEQIEKQKEKERLAKEKEKQKEKERLAKEKEKQKEKERLAREKEKQKEKERLAREKEKQKEKERLAKEKEKQKEKERLAKEKEKQKELEKKLRQEEKKKAAKEANANVSGSKIMFETEEQPIKDVVQSMEVEKEETYKEKYVPVDEVQEEKPSKMTFEEMLAKKKKDDSKATEIPTDNISKLRQRMEANRKLEQGIVENDSKKAQAIEESKNKFKQMNSSYEEEAMDDLYQQLEDLEAKVAELEAQNKDLENEIKLLSSEDSGNLAVVVDKLDKQLDDKNEELERKERLIEDLKAEVNELRDENAELQAKVEDNKDNEDFESQIEDLEDENQELSDTIDELESQNKELAEEQEKLNQANHELEAKLAELVGKLQDSQDVEKIANLEKENQELTAKVEELEAKVESLTEETETYKEQIEKLQAENNGKDEEIAALRSDLEALQAEQKDAEEELEAVKELEKVKEELQKLEEENEELRKFAEEKEVSGVVVVNEENKGQEGIDISESELNAKIEEIKNQLEEKDNQLASISSKVDELTEKDIRDPEFTRTIIAIRERKQQVINRMNEEKQIYENSYAKNKAQLEEAFVKYSEVKARRDELDDEYKNVGEQTSLRREEYLAKSQKITFEEENIQRRIDERKEDDKVMSEKFAQALAESEKEINELNKKEVETIEYYLNKLKAEYSEGDENYQKYAEEKLELLKQLDDLNVLHLQMQVALEQNKNLVRENLKNNEEVLERIADEEYIENRKEKIEYQIECKNLEYESLLTKIAKIKEHQEKRIKSEKVLRITDEAIVKYNDVLTDYETLILRYQTNDEVLGILKQELEGLDAENDIEQIESLNTKITNVEILQNDISDKINYCKEIKDSLEEDDKVNYYIKLLKSMEQLKVKNIEFRVQANNVKARIEELNEELENLK